MDCEKKFTTYGRVPWIRVEFVELCKDEDNECIKSCLEGSMNPYYSGRYESMKECIKYRLPKCTKID